MIRFLLTGWLVFCLAWTATAWAEDVSPQANYERDVLPLLRKHCADCHTTDTSEGRWAFDGYSRHADLITDQKAWKKVEQLVASHIMPPVEHEPPSARERRVILDWIDGTVFHVDPRRPDPGRTTLRRLNQAEYNNTVRDVFGTEGRPADQFPADDSGYGFDNIGDVLSISPLHVEKYLAAAREVANEATRLQTPPRVGVERTGDKLHALAGKPQPQGNMMILHSPEDEVGETVQIPVRGIYRVLTRASVAKRDERPSLALDILCDGEPIGRLTPTAEWQGRPGPVSTVFALVELPEGEHRIGLRVSEPDGRPDSEGSACVVFLGIAGPFTPMPPRVSEYLQTAAGSRPLGPPILRLSGEDLDFGSGRSSLDTGRAWFASTGYRHAPVLIRTPGTYRMRFKVGAQQVGDEPVRFEVRLGDQTLGPVAVTAAAQAEQWVEIEERLSAGQHDWQVWFVNEYKDPETGAERWFWLHEFTIEGPLEGDYGLSRAEAVELVKQTGRRLFRRPLADDESRNLVRLLDSATAAGEAPQSALRGPLEAMLASPKFLFHPAPQPLGDKQLAPAKLPDGTALVDEWTLASRLSYFLWSSAPDDPLLVLAERGELRAQFAAQVRRMIEDPRSQALTENFAGQWLQLRNLEHAAPDAMAFPEFDAQLAADMRRESELLFEHILRANRTVLDFLAADYTFLNARLARHYGLPEPAGEGFHRVSLANSPRRGVVTHGSVLTLTSHPTRTSPVNRGKWILEQMLGVEPPPAPRDIPPLGEQREDEALSLRTRLEQHRSDPSCASCHALLDPMGFALENYDAIGRWRATEAERPIDTTGRLVTGEEFSDWSEVRDLLVNRRQEDFVRCLTEHLLTYALGRGVTYQDKVAVRTILARSEASHYGFQDLILAVCESVPFQRMRHSAEPLGSVSTP